MPEPMTLDRLADGILFVGLAIAGGICLLGWGVGWLHDELFKEIRELKEESRKRG